MIKKNLWIVALIAIFAITFMGCPDNWGDLKNKPEGGAAEGDLVIEDADEIGALLSAKGWNGNAGANVSTAKNVAIFNIPDGGSTDNQGFELLFPEDAEGFSALDVTFKLAEVTTIGEAGRFAKIGFKSAITPGTVDVTPYDKHEITFGTAADVGTEKTQTFTLASPNKLPNNAVYFSQNQYGDGAAAGSKAPVVYKLEITKLHFKAEAPKPCCEKKCIKSKCKDCSEDKCIGECGVTCCLNYNGTDATVVFVKGATPAADKVVHTNPPVVAREGGAVMNAGGVVTMNNYSLLFYQFPTDGKDGTGTDAKDVKIDYMDYDYIDITYTLSNANNVNSAAVAANGTNMKIEWRDYEGVAAYSTGRWDDLGGVGADKTKTIQTWGDNGTGGFVIRLNSYDTKPNAGDGTCAEFIDIKITKVEFRKGSRFKVEFFSPLTPNNNNLKTLEVLSGNTLGNRLPKVSNPGWTHTGWVDAWEALVNQPGSSANTVGSSTVIDGSGLNFENGVLKLFATWMFIPLSDITATAAANDTLFIKSPAAWAGSGFTDTTITIGGKKYWVVGDYREVGSAPGVAVGIETKLIASDTDFTAIKAHHGLGYTRIYVDLATLSNSWSNFSTVTLTYDMIEVSTNGTASGEGSRGVQFKNNNGGSGGNFANNTWPNGANDTPWLDAGEGKTFTIPISAFTQGANLSIVKNGQTNGNQGAMLLRITKIELKL